MAEITVCRDPVFVIGAPRSGTSVLAWAIAQHEGFWTAGETDYLYALFGQGRLNRMWLDCGAGTDRNWLARNGFDRGRFAEALGLGLSALMSAKANGRRWVDQTPTYTTMLTELAQIFPEARFVHIMRDGRSVVHSMINSQMPSTWATDFRDACRTWSWYVEKAAAFGSAAPDRYLAVPYELLDEDPDELFRRIFTFLDARESEAPAAFVRTTRINSSYQPDGPADGAYLGPTSPWWEWSEDQRETFVAEAGKSFVTHRFGSEADLVVEV